MSRPIKEFAGSLLPIIVYMDNHDYFINSDDTCTVWLPNPGIAPVGYEVTIYGANNTIQGDALVKCMQNQSTDFRYNGSESNSIAIACLSSATFKNMGNTWAVIAKG